MALVQSFVSNEPRADLTPSRPLLTEEDILQEAERADVDRERHLDAQIEWDRQTSDDVDLLPGKR
ncbi:MAG: hypothetical protein HF981_10910 [Desulfobacteraceae bacterium]|nr:hypothetical protein [Desulfobacteraceae bacterium]MBC2750884.1 hypothetical protein [Desulfobacteraceae bacterium]